MEFYLIKLHLKSHYKAFHFHQYFHYFLQLIYQLTFFYTHIFFNLNILQHHIIYHTSHLHLPSFHLCLLLQTLASNLHLHLQVLCHSICLVLLVLDIYVFNGIRNTYFNLWVINGIATAFAFIYCNAIGIKHSLISADIDYF